jgi:moderate conductance mechanosensitive channel
MAAIPIPQIPEFADFYPFVYHVARILAILLGAYIVVHFIHRSIPELRKRIVESMQRRGRGGVETEKRAATLGAIFRKTVAAIIWVVAVIMALKEAGFDIGPILAGAGVVGLAVGFGAQNLVRDIVSGLFILLEDQVRVNDVAVINGTGGLVEQINLRTMVLRGQDGTVHVFPNGSITSLANMTHDYSYYVFDVGVAYKEDTDRVARVLKEIGDDLMKDEKFRPLILEPLEVLGVDKFADSAVIIKARIKTPPIQQWTVGREMNRRIKKRFDQEGIEIPFPHTSLYFGEASKPLALQMRYEREELKAAIREVLQEQQAGNRAPEGGPAEHPSH